jgi:hypothetical protein
MKKMKSPGKFVAIVGSVQEGVASDSSYWCLQTDSPIFCSNKSATLNRQPDTTMNAKYK